MIAKFKNTEEAVDYVCREFYVGGLGRYAQVSWFASGDMDANTSAVVPISRLTITVTNCCNRFPQATIALNMAEGSRPTGAIQCRCDSATRKACPKGCRHRIERPITCIMACDKGDQPSEEEKLLALHAIHKMIHAYQSESRNRARRREGSGSSISSLSHSSPENHRGRRK